tara:strand:+ start:161 stop:550 length:390 start_codon:yes stop_codon:yes gene_type:complete
MSKPKNAMTKREAKPFKQMLTVLRARLRGDVSGLADAALNKNPAAGSGSTLSNHMADMGSDQYEQDFSLSLMANEEEVLEQIDAALMRIESGTYGACDECGSKIPKMRLNAIPFTAYCVRCADQIQRGG